MKIKAVMFDYGNVLGRDGDLKLFNYLAEKMKKSKQEISKIVTEELKDLFIGKISEDLFWKNFLNRFDYRENLDCSNIFREIYSQFLIPSEKVLGIAKKIREKGIATGILSNMILPLSDICKNKNYFSGFDPVIISAEKGLMKPEREIYLKMLNIINAKNPEEVVYIDDKEEYLIPAENLGIRTILFNINLSENPKKELEERLREVRVNI